MFNTTLTVDSRAHPAPEHLLAMWPGAPPSTEDGWFWNMTNDAPWTTSAISYLGVNLSTTTEVFMPWDNPYNVISYTTLRQIVFVVECGIQTSMFFVGAPGNLLNTIVFARQGLRDRMNFLLFSRALVDLLFVTVIFLGRGPFCFGDDTNYRMKEFLKWSIRKWLLSVSFGFLYSSGWLTAIIAVERCVCVMLPMKAATLVKTRTVVLLSCSIVLIINVLCCVYVVMHSVVSVQDAVSGDIGFVLGYSDFYIQHKTLIDTVDHFVLPVVTFVTYLIVTIATLITVANLKKAMAWRQNTSNAGHGRQMALVKMLVTVSCIYIACTAPIVALALTRFVVHDLWPTGRYSHIFHATHQIATAFLMLNSLLNFFVYVGQSSRFQQELRSLTCRKDTSSATRLK